ncbi:MAG: type II toxin-antitoxin system CcdA family antitoxin [Hyphomicrobiales bacterium]|nr:type II toxin-antitoxin system CcdA family antitoxin [Hyphomicrobiales bacterium]MBV8824230.1 type II toxin-antitoxin system CcdA family antitoxin [Hyphomicrobiales bacterium]MBV9429293.1 type II toxin-antitoxin system CcdA family antitoxin [Bradyrhizobiaceae bacterium]
MTERERRWLEKNREALNAYNERAAEHGLLSDSAGVLITIRLAAKQAP